MVLTKTAAVLNVGQNGQVTIPSDYRKEYAMKGGDHMVSLRMGDALVLIPPRCSGRGLASRRLAG